MRVFIIGGSGRTGSLAVDEAIRRGHSVVALVRKPDSLTAREGLTTIIGSPLSPADVDAAFARATAETSPPLDAVILALNARRVSDSPFAAPSPDTPPTMLADAAKHAVAAMERHGVRKLVVMSAQGTGSSRAGLNLLLRFMFAHSNMRFQMDDHDKMDAFVREAAARDGTIDYVLVRPAMLTDGEAKEVKLHGETGSGAGFLPQISRKSVAKFMVEATESKEWDGTAQVVTN